MSFIRDKNGALINTDDRHYRALLAARESQKREAAATAQFNAIQSEIEEIKKVLASIAGKQT